MSTNQNDAILREWRDSAVYWKKHCGTIHTMLSPVTQAMIEEAEIVAGQSVLDVAGGAGEPSLTIADPNSPGAFRFAEPGVLAGLLSDAGAKDVKERELKFQIAAAISLEQFWEMRSETSEILRAKLATLSPPQAELLAREAQKAVREFFADNQ